MSEDVMLGSSPLHPKACGLRADVCTRCAESYEQIGGNDAQMKAYADMCRRCASSCQQMAAMAKLATSIDTGTFLTMC